MPESPLQARGDEPVVHVVDDDEAVRDSLDMMLTSAGFRVRLWPSGSALLAELDHLQDGCILLDVRMPEIDGLALLDRFHLRGRRFPVVIMTGHADIPMAVRAMKAGALDFIEKPANRETILNAIRAALAARTRAGPEGDHAIRLASLTPREREVMAALIGGLPNKVIAHELGISPRTVEIHRARVMDKMQARSLPDLVRIGLAAGLAVEGRT